MFVMYLCACEIFTEYSCVKYSGTVRDNCEQYFEGLERICYECPFNAFF